MAEELFEDESKSLEKYTHLLNDSASFDASQYKDALKELQERYSDLLTQTKFLTRMGDRLENRLRLSNLLLEDKNKKIENFLAEIKEQNERLNTQNAKIEAMNASLEELVQQRTNAWQETNQELNTFIYRSSHDLRSPLSSLLGLMDILKIVSNHPEVINIAKLAQRTTRSMDRMLEKMRTVYDSNETYATSEVNVNQVIEQAKTALDFEFAENSVDFINQCPPSLTIKTNGERLQSIVENLLENAIQFRSTTNGQSFVKIEVVSSNPLHLTVEDNGIGIGHDKLEEIFNAFVRGFTALEMVSGYTWRANRP